jgi:hypothetical protein
MLDLGYQCCDMRPYFEYSNGNNLVYINIHPNNIVSKNINVYESTKQVVDRIEYTSMKYIGTTSDATKTTLIYNDITYNYTNTVINVRGFYINKWSLFKPIKLNKISDLNRDYVYPDTIQQKLEHGGEFKGTFSENTSGIIYGLKVGTATWNNLHNCAWAYVGVPTPNSNVWFRMTDFEEYYKEAKPSLLGDSIELKSAKRVTTASENPFNVSLFRIPNEHSVDILKCITSLDSDGNIKENIKDYYLCALVSEGEVDLTINNNRTWCRALTNGDFNQVTPIVYKDREGNEIEVKDFKCPQFSEDMNKYLIKSTTGRGLATITVFLADLDKVENLEELGSFKNEWVYLGMDQIRYTLGVSVPELAGLEVVVSKYLIDFSYAYISSAIYNPDTQAIDCLLQFSDKVKEPRTYRVAITEIQKVYPEIGETQPGMESFTYYGGHTEDNVLGVPFSFSFKQQYRPMSGDKYRFVIAVNGIEGDIVNQRISTYEGEITIP